MVNLAGKTAVVTGASRGIGKAVAQRVAEHGANVVLAARTPGALEAAAAEIRGQYGVQAIAVATDVGVLADLENLVTQARAHFGTIDILINGAGVSSQSPFDRQPIEDLERLANVNFLGYVRLIRLVIPEMVERKDGIIISVLSGSTLVDPIPRGFLAYSSLKMGLRAFLKGLFWEMREHNIKVTSILPGVVDSELTDHLTEIATEQRDRLLAPSMVADMVSYALSVPNNANPLELAVINQLTPWTKPVIDYRQTQAR